MKYWTASVIAMLLSVYGKVYRERPCGLRCIGGVRINRSRRHGGHRDSVLKDNVL